MSTVVLAFFDAAEVRDIQALIRYLAQPGSELRAAELARSRILGISDTALYRLAQAGGRGSSPIGRWLSGSPVPEEISLSKKDRALIEWARERVPQWVALSDRMPAAEQIEQILNEVDYAGWFRGEEQGWENLKKTLELIRRAQNRGYLTLSRLVEFLERASLSDESLAVIEAAEAVNLMTIHASKGLEFDTVFLVNMEQATGKDRSLPRVAERPNGTFEIHALAPGNAPENEPSRSIEEEKRLLYVATTRARRRVILSAMVDDNPIEPSSLLGLLPPSLQRVIFESCTQRTNRRPHRMGVERELLPTSVETTLSNVRE